MRLPSADHTAGEYTSFLNVKRVRPPLARSSIQRSPGTLYGESFAMARVPSGDNTTRPSVPGGPDVLRVLPCRSTQASWKVPGAAVVRYTHTPASDTANAPVTNHVIPTS